MSLSRHWGSVVMKCLYLDYCHALLMSCRLHQQSVVLVRFHWKTLTSWTKWQSSSKTLKWNLHWTLALKKLSQSWKSLWRKLVHIQQMMTPKSEQNSAVGFCATNISVAFLLVTEWPLVWKTWISRGVWHCHGNVTLSWPHVRENLVWES